MDGLPRSKGKCEGSIPSGFTKHKEKDMKYPFQISKTFNQQMKCHELLLQIGGIKDKEELETFAAALAEFVANGGEIKRVGFDA